MRTYFLVVGKQTSEQEVNILQAELLPAKRVRSIKKADVIVAIGGDGTLLHAINQFYACGLPFIGINNGHVGFLMNSHDLNVLNELREEKITEVTCFLLRGEFYDQNGKFLGESYAFNEIHMRSFIGTAHITVVVDGDIYWEKMPCDGVMAATPQGSTAYNMAAHGHVLPLELNAFVVTPICAVPQHYPPVVLESSATVSFIAEDFQYGDRRVFSCADGTVYKRATHVDIVRSDINVTILYGESVNFKQKTRRYQFKPNKL